MTVTGFAKDLKPVTVRLTVTGVEELFTNPSYRHMSYLIVLDFCRSHYWHNWIPS